MIPSIYQTLLQDEYEKLSPILRDIHGPMPQMNGKGVVHIEYGNGYFVKILNRIFGMPSQGSDIPTRLHVTRTAEKEIWTREFGREVFRTEQYIGNGYLLEQMGNILLAFSLHEKESRLEFKQEYTCVYGIKLPRIMSVMTTASLQAEKDGWHINVETRVPIVGLLLKYYGSFEVEA